MKKFTAILLSILTLFCFILFGCNEESNTEDKALSLSLKNGIVSLSGVDGVSKYEIYTGENLLITTTENTVDLAGAIIENRVIPFGEWKINVKGYNESGEMVAKTDKTVNFNVIEVNQANAYNVLKSEYNPEDYFLFSEDIYLYGRTERSTGSMSDYQTVVFSADDRSDNNNALFFFNKPLTATVDGNGYSLNVAVDEHINWASLPFVYGGIFSKIESGGEVKNLQVFSDCVYEVKSRHYSSASFIYQLYGRIENVFVSQISRPMIRPDVKEHDTDNYLDKVDNCLAVISQAYNGAEILNSVLKTAIYNVAGEKIAGGGAVARSEVGVKYNSCAYVSEFGDARFFTPTMDKGFYKASGDQISVTDAQDIFFFSTVQDFISGVGKKVDGALLWTPAFADFSGDAVSLFGDCFSIVDGELYLLDRQIIVFE